MIRVEERVLAFQTPPCRDSGEPDIETYPTLTILINCLTILNVIRETSYRGSPYSPIKMDPSQYLMRRTGPERVALARMLKSDAEIMANH